MNLVWTDLVMLPANGLVIGGPCRGGPQSGQTTHARDQRQQGQHAYSIHHHTQTGYHHSPCADGEVATALARERQQGTTILFPVRIDNTVMTLETGWPALIRNTRNIGDFRRWRTHDVYQKAFDRLLRDLKAAERQPEGSRPGE